MIRNKKKTGTVWRIGAQGLITVLEEFVRGEREMSTAQVSAALALIRFAAALPVEETEEALKDLA